MQRELSPGGLPGRACVINCLWPAPESLTVLWSECLGPPGIPMLKLNPQCDDMKRRGLLGCD